MAKTKDAVLTPGQKELMEKEYLDFVKPSTHGNKSNPSSCNSLYDDVENPEQMCIRDSQRVPSDGDKQDQPNLWDDDARQTVSALSRIRQY